MQAPNDPSGNRHGSTSAKLEIDRVAVCVITGIDDRRCVLRACLATHPRTGKAFPILRSYGNGCHGFLGYATCT
jgi:hypothetical protein